jgi:hypothetical protein
MDRLAIAGCFATSILDGSYSKFSITTGWGTEESEVTQAIAVECSEILFQGG